MIHSTGIITNTSHNWGTERIMFGTALALSLLTGLLPLSAEPEIRVVTYNLHHAEGTDGVLDLDRIATVITDERPDIVCLQEVDRNCARTHRVDMPAELAKRLNMEYAFGPNLDLEGGAYGNSTLSRFPIVESANFSLPFVEGGERRGCLRTVVNVDGRDIDVLNTHFDLLPQARKEQAARVVDLARDLPTILAGDLNERPDGPAITILLTRYRDTFGAAESATSMPDQRIDFVLVSGSINAVSSRFVDTPVARVASDHLPYVARVSLGPAPETVRDRGIRDNQDERVNRAILPGDH